MNKLSFGLLSFLSTQPLSGYDLYRRLNTFWNTNHSAIYTLLSELEDKGYVRFSLITQTNKPDKKLYEITEVGMEKLKKWIKSKTGPAVVKDEMMLKLFCLQVLDKQTVEGLLDEMELIYNERLDKYLNDFEKLKSSVGDSFESTYSHNFGVYVLLQKLISEVKLEINWCNWLRGLYGIDGQIEFVDNYFIDKL